MRDGRCSHSASKDVPRFHQPQHNASVGQPLLLLKRAADFTHMREVGRSFFILRHSCGCRDPPHLESGFQMISDKEVCRNGRKQKVHDYG